MYQQQNFQAAYDTLIKLEKVFQDRNLTRVYISALITLVKASLAIGKEPVAYQLLVKIESLVENVELSNEQIELYLLLSSMYQSQGKYEKAVKVLTLYTQLNEKFNYSKELTPFLFGPARDANDKSKQLAAKLAEKSVLHATFSNKLNFQSKLLVFMTLLVILLFLTLIGLLLKQRAERLRLAYNEIEKPAHFLANPIQTKQFYRLTYKKARKYEFPLAIPVVIQNAGI